MKLDFEGSLPQNVTLGKTYCFAGYFETFFKNFYNKSRGENHLIFKALNLFPDQIHFPKKFTIHAEDFMVQTDILKVRNQFLEIFSFRGNNHLKLILILLQTALGLEIYFKVLILGKKCSGKTFISNQISKTFDTPIFKGSDLNKGDFEPKIKSKKNYLSLESGIFQQSLNSLFVIDEVDSIASQNSAMLFKLFSQGEENKQKFSMVASARINIENKNACSVEELIDLKRDQIDSFDLISFLDDLDSVESQVIESLLCSFGFEEESELKQKQVYFQAYLR